MPVPSEHAERGGRARAAKEVLRGSLGPSWGAFPGVDITTGMQPVGQVPREGQVTGNPLIMALKWSRGTEFNGIITQNGQSWDIPSWKNR